MYLFDTCRVMADWMSTSSCYALFGDDERPKRHSRASGVGVDETSSWYFRRDILDKLDEYYRIIRRMRHTDIDGYNMYSSVGAYLARSIDSYTTLGPTWSDPKTRPAFGAVAFLHKDSTDFVGLKFAYIYRINNYRLDIEPYYGQLYGVVLFYAETTKKGSASFRFYVDVGADRSIRPLKYQTTVPQILRHKDNISRKGGAKQTAIYRHGMSYGSYLENPEKCREQYTIQDNAATLFSMIASNIEASRDGFRVDCRKDGVTAVFNINLLRTPYFFDDREKVSGDTGKTKKIFHIVRTHKRALHDGSTQFVRSHFRGLRKFEWNGHQVTITLPGKHHQDYMIGDELGSLEDVKRPARRNELSMGQFGERIRRITMGAA